MWFDIVITNGFVVDGTGNPWFKADIGIKDGKITDIGDLKSAKAYRSIDAKGLFVSPGFIDTHTHSDTTLLLANRCESHIMQGVTTECVGNCGSSPYPITEKNKETICKRMSRIAGGPEIDIDWSTLDGYIRRVEKKGISINVAALVGHGTVRAAVIGMENRAPTPEELEEMKSLVDGAMQDGAFGLSSGLDYMPGCYAETGEVIEVMKVASKYGGIYASDVREQILNSFIKAVEQCIEIGEKSGARVVHTSHAKPVFPRWGDEIECMRLWEEARERGVDATADIIFPVMCKKLSSIIPPWWRKEGSEELINKLKDPDTRKKIKHDTLTADWHARGRETGERPNFNNFVKAGRWGDIQLCSIYRQKMLKNEKFVGKSLAEIAELRGVDPFDAACDLIIEENDKVSGLAPGSQVSAGKILIKHPVVMAASDSSCKAATSPWTDQWAQPLRDYGTYAYLLGTWVREEHVLSLEEMIRKCTSLPARTLGLRDRGLIAEGMYADFVVFNMDTMEDKSTHEDPHQYPEGVEYVIVNGQIVVEKGEHTGKLPGKFLRYSPH